MILSLNITFHEILVSYYLQSYLRNVQHLHHLTKKYTYHYNTIRTSLEYRILICVEGRIIVTIRPNYKGRIYLGYFPVYSSGIHVILQRNQLRFAGNSTHLSHGKICMSRNNSKQRIASYRLWALACEKLDITALPMVTIR